MLTKQDLINLINIVSQVSRPVASEEATYLRTLLLKLNEMEQLKPVESKKQASK